MKRHLALLLIAAFLTGCARDMRINPISSTPAAAAAVTASDLTDPVRLETAPAARPVTVRLSLPYPDAPGYQISYAPDQWRASPDPVYLTNPLLLVHEQIDGCQIELVFPVGFEGEAFIPHEQAERLGGRAWQALEGLGFYTVVEDPTFPGLRLIGVEQPDCRNSQYEVLATLTKSAASTLAQPVGTPPAQAVLAITPLPGPVSLPSPDSGSSFACPGAISPRLKVGQYARALTFLNIRSSPERQIENVIGLVQAETTVAIVEGPVCSDDGAVSFWKISYHEGITSTLSGWVAEGQAGEYFLEPK